MNTIVQWSSQPKYCLASPVKPFKDNNEVRNVCYGFLKLKKSKTNKTFLRSVNLVYMFS
jgi:hypothetical protein